eukprot:COSAG03_NODE_3030_length_2277_cov_2.747934_4_plen_74_part_00
MEQVIGCHEHPTWLVEVAAQLCDSGESGIDLIVELYKELLSRVWTLSLVLAEKCLNAAKKVSGNRKHVNRATS